MMKKLTRFSLGVLVGVWIGVVVTASRVITTRVSAVSPSSWIKELRESDTIEAYQDKQGALVMPIQEEPRGKRRFSSSDVIAQAYQWRSEMLYDNFNNGLYRDPFKRLK